MRALSLFFAICFLAAGQAPPAAPNPAANQPPADVKPEDKCVVEGSVVNGTTGEALKKAHVTLRRADNTQSNPVPYGATTDASGHFVIDDVDPGKYRLAAERNGFVGSSYGEKRNRPGSGALLTLAAGQKFKDANFHMTPQGVVAGRVLDEDGEPVARANVMCLRSMYRNGEKGLFPSGGASTDDKGEYRAFGLSPGKYLVSATYNSRQEFGPAERRKEGSNEQSYVQTFYPSVASRDAAISVTVTPGAELSGMDIKLIRARAVRLSGKVTNRANQYEQTMVQLVTRGSSDWSNVKRTNTDTKGNFLFRGILPGSYLLRVDVYSDGEPRNAIANVEVADSDVTDLQLSLGKNPDITGKIQADGQVDFSGPPMHVQLQSIVPTSINYGGSGDVKDDQTFKASYIGPDRYRITVFPVPDGCYVKSYRWGDGELADGILDLTKGATAGELSIVISANAGQIDGSAHDANQQASVGAIVILTPSEGGRHDFYKRTVTDQNGRFTIKQITPGKYKLYAFDDLEPGANEDPEFMKPFESRGEAMDIRDGAKESKDLVVISTDDSPAAPKPSAQ